jgi:magnesium-transporting ATPase (P-type)
MLGVAMLAFAGFAALCLAMDKHASDLLKRRPTPAQSRLARGVGWGLLLVSLLLAVQRQGWAYGLVQWTAVSMAGLLIWVFGLPYQPRALLGLAAVSLVLGPVLALWPA